MKRVLPILLVLTLTLMLAGLAGCGNKADDQPAEELVMATNASFPPYEYKDDNDGFVGIDIEIAQAIADKLGRKLVINDVEFGSIVGGVQSGKYDIGMAGMTITDERKQSVDFTDSYATGIQSVIVKADSKYTSFEEFYTGFDEDGNPTGVKDGITIGVQQDTTGDIYSSDEPSKWGFTEGNVMRYKTGNDAVQALVSGKVTAVIIDKEPAKSYVASNEGLKILDGAYTEEDYAICVAKNNTELRDKVNSALKELIADGTVQKIVDKYIHD